MCEETRTHGSEGGMAQRCAVPTRLGSAPMVRAPGCCRTRGASLLSAPLPAERALGAKKRRHKGSARVGTPKTAGPGGRRWLARFWGALARTTAGATLLPLCALPYRMVLRARDCPCSVLDPCLVRRRWRLESLRAFAAFRHSLSMDVRIGALGEPASSRGALCPRLTGPRTESVFRCNCR